MDSIASSRAEIRVMNGQFLSFEVVKVSQIMNIQCTFCIFVSWRTFAVVILSADICPFYGNDYLFDCKTPSGVFMAVHFPSGDHVANWINWSVFSVYYNWISIAKHKNELKGTNDLMGNTYILNIFLNNPIIYILTYKLYNFLN